MPLAPAHAQATLLRRGPGRVPVAAQVLCKLELGRNAVAADPLAAAARQAVLAPDRAGSALFNVNTLDPSNLNQPIRKGSKVTT